MVVDVGLDLAPEGTTGATAAEADLFDGNAEFMEEREGVFEREGDAFEDSADVVRSGGGGGDADEGGAGVGVEVGGAFAEEVGCPEEAVGAGWDVGGEFRELVIGGGGHEGVAEVAEAEARAVGDAHDMPDAGRGVAEGVEAALGVERWGGGCGKDSAGGAGGRGEGAGGE